MKIQIHKFGHFFENWNFGHNLWLSNSVKRVFVIFVALFLIVFLSLFCGLRSRAPKKKELKEDDEDGFDEMEEAIEAANAADLAEIEAEGAKKPKR